LATSQRQPKGTQIASVAPDVSIQYTLAHAHARALVAGLARVMRRRPCSGAPLCNRSSFLAQGG
jgi:hypothetical protein